MVISMDRWKGKVAVVTGASSGIGAAIAEALVQNGLKVVGLARRQERVEELANKLQDKPGKLYALKADMTVESDVIKAFEWIEENLGAISILVNNAGLMQLTTLIDGDTEKWKRVLDTNVLGLCIATREAVKSMKKHDIAGHVVHINSVLGHYAYDIPNANVYIASKFAVTALTETLRQELISAGSKIKVTSVSPGPVKTEFAQDRSGVDNAEFSKLYDNIPKLLSEDVADAVTYALSTPPHVQIHELLFRPLGANV